MKLHRLAALLCVIVASAIAHGALALAASPTAPADTPPPPRTAAESSSSGNANSGELEEVIVTAQKRQERLIDVPQSVSVISADTLARLGASGFRDFAATVPGLSFKTSGVGMNQVSLRGVTTGTDSSATVGIYVDEVPYGSSTPFAFAGRFALDVGLFDIDRIEVLRGPQGTLYGASSMGGLLKYVTKQPDARQFGVDVRTGLSTTRDGGAGYNGSIVLNTPLSKDKAALRVSGFYSHDGGFIDDVVSRHDNVDRSDVYGGRADLLLTPTDALSVRLVAFAQNISRDGESSADYSFAGEPINGELGQRRGFPDTLEQHFRLTSGTAAYNFGPVSLTSVSSYQTARSAWLVDATDQFAPLFGLGAFADSVLLTTEKFTQELRLASQGNAPIEWTVGAFYTHEDAKDDEQFVLRDPAGHPVPNNLFIFSLPTRYEEYAGFGDLTWRITDRFDLGGGVRIAKNRQEFTQTASGLFAVSTPTLRSSEDVTTYLANARFHVSERATAYSRFATGYRPGGPTIVTISDPTSAASFGADHLKSYEVGFRADMAERRFGVDVAAFYIDWGNIQTFTTTSDNFGTFVNAAAGASIRGAELSLIARPVVGFTASGAFAYQDAHMSGADPKLGAAKGERLPNVPRFTGALSADYEWPLASTFRPTLGATVRHISDRTVSFDGSSQFRQYHLPEYTSVDLRTDVTVNMVDVQLYVHNLFDERGQLSATTQFGKPQVAILEPRTVGISLMASF